MTTFIIGLFANRRVVVKTYREEFLVAGFLSEMVLLAELGAEGLYIWWANPLRIGLQRIFDQALSVPS